MAAKADIDVAQLYDIANGAAGASWMFTDRGKRMLEEEPEVKSALAIFVKDLDIVYAESKKLMSPIPVATAALQQFISGQSLGLGKLDDSQVVKVYENVTKVPVVGRDKTEAPTKAALCIENDYVTVSKTTKAQKAHSDGMLFLSDKADSVSLSLDTLLIDIAFKNRIPISNKEALSIPMHELSLESDKLRIYRVTIPSGGSLDISYPFFHLTISITSGSMNVAVITGKTESSLQWTEYVSSGTVSWNQPILDRRVTNSGDSALVQYVAEFL
jgi:hypothetical protein